MEMKKKPKMSDSIVKSDFILLFDKLILRNIFANKISHSYF